MNINDLKSTMTAGFARPNRYAVFFHKDTSTLSWMVDNVSLPGRQLSSSDRYTDMRVSKIAYAFINEDITMTFLLSNNFESWNFLKEWQDDVITNMGELGGYKVRFKRDYSKDFIIKALDMNDKTTKEIKVLGAYPTSLQSIELSNSSENEVIRCTATFSYETWQET